MRNGPDRLRALNVPQQVKVELDANGLPAKAGAREVEVIGEQWRIDDEWWRQPIARWYVEVVLEGGKRVVLYKDLMQGEWFVQKPA